MTTPHRHGLLPFGHQLNPQSPLGRLRAGHIPTDFRLSSLDRNTAIDISNYFSAYQDDFSDFVMEQLRWMESLSPILRVRIHLAEIANVLVSCWEGDHAEAAFLHTLQQVCDQLVQMTCAHARSEVVWTDDDERAMHNKQP